MWNAFVPEKWGGGGVTDLLPRTLIREELGATSYVLRSYVDNGLFDLDTVSEYQREKYFLPALEGEKRSFAGITEPDAGSDNGAMKTTARREGDEWILNGTKHFSLPQPDHGTVADRGATPEFVWLALCVEGDDDP